VSNEARPSAPARVLRHVRAHALGLIAIFLALGGGAYAATNLGRNSVGSKQIRNGHVQRRDLAGSAVTGGKVKRHSLAGSDLKTGTVGGRALNDSALFTRTKIVDPAGTPAQNGKDLIAAVNSIDDSGASNPYLVQLGPGTYDLGELAIAMPRYVELAGAGPGVTTVTSSTETLNSAPADELRDLRIDAQGPAATALTVTDPMTVYDSLVTASGSGATAFNIAGGGSLDLRDSAIEVDAGNGTSAVTALNLNSGSATLASDSVTATASSTAAVAVSNRNGSAALRSSTVKASGSAGSASYGLATSGTGTITADSSSIAGSAAAINNNGNSQSTIRVGASKVDGAALTPGFGTVTCVASYSAAYAPLSAACG
jgi:hypothetical protein